MAEQRRIIVGISGASGVIYGVRLLEVLRERTSFECHVIMTPTAELTLRLETKYRRSDVKRLAHRLHDHRNLAASLSSGSVQTAGMIIAPCSMRTLGAVVNSLNDNLLIRAADVCLKERRPLILMIRETPLHLGHLRLLVQAAEIGAVILPPVPAFYQRPKTIDDLIMHSIGKALDQFGVDVHAFRRWQEPPRETLPFKRREEGRLRVSDKPRVVAPSAKRAKPE